MGGHWYLAPIQHASFRPSYVDAAFSSLRHAGSVPISIEVDNKKVPRGGQTSPGGPDERGVAGARYRDCVCSPPGRTLED